MSENIYEAIKDSDGVDCYIKRGDIVRCKDCKHRYMDGEVTHYYWCKLHDRPVDDTDYCSWGEERSEE